MNTPSYTGTSKFGGPGALAGSGIFRNRWWIVFASVLGLMASQGSILIFGSAVFLKPVTEDLGIGRSAFSFGLTVAALLFCLRQPGTGMADRQTQCPVDFAVRHRCLCSCHRCDEPVGAIARCFLFAVCGVGTNDFMAIFVSRYFGLKAFGQLYGYMICVLSIGSGLGATLMGVSFDRAHSYWSMLSIFEVLLVVSCVLIAPLGPYRFPARPSTTSGR